VFEPQALRTLVDTLGASQVMTGSDYPYPLGERPVGEVVRRSDFLTRQQREALLFGNARRFLGWPRNSTVRCSHLAVPEVRATPAGGTSPRKVDIYEHLLRFIGAWPKIFDPESGFWL